MKKRLMCLLLSCIMAMSCVINAAAYTQYEYYMPNGAMWTWNNKFDLGVTGSWSSNDYANAPMYSKVEYITPDQVELLYEDIYDQMASDEIKTVFSFVRDAVINYGSQKAKTMLISKFGATVASKFIPFLNAISWGITALDILSAVSTGLSAQFIGDLHKAGQGMIVGTGRQNAGALYLRTAWTGKWGTYPYGKSPNNYQFGDWTIY